MPTMPNLLIVMTDQQRGDVILDGHPCRTPVMDTFRQRGTTFSHAFCPSPHCCPSRATFFTGLYPSQHGVWNNVAVQNALSRDCKPGTRFWSQDLAAAGYDLHYTGKWHVSHEQAPRDVGWNERLVTAAPRKDGAQVMGQTWDGYAQHATRPPRTSPRGPGEILRPGWGDYTHYGIHERPFNDQGVVDTAVELLRTTCTPARPWALYCGLLGPHDPYIVPQRFLDLYRDVDIPLPVSFNDAMLDKPSLYRRTRRTFDQLTPAEHREAIRHYWAFCSYEDWLFGQLLDALTASGQADDTVVLFTSDHGDYAGEHGLWCKGLPCFRSAYHIPWVMAGPGIGAGRTIEAPVTLADMAPTVLELAQIAPQAHLAGRSLLPWLRGETPTAWRDAIYTQTNGNEQYGIQRSVTTGGWKYVYNGFDEDELYDLEHDPHEMRNLARDPQHAERIRTLCGRLWAFAREHDDTCINGYIMVGMAPHGPAEGCRPGVIANG